MNVAVAYVPVAPKEKALELARGLVESHLVACANLFGPITATYRWKGKVESGEEYVLWLKTADAKRAEVEDYLEAHHPYELHGIVWLEPRAVNAPFAEWIRHSVR